MHRARSFMSGNSVAVRLPKALGVRAGEEFEVVLTGGGGFDLVPVRRTVDVGKFAGKASPDFMAEGRGEIEQEERDWTAPERRVAAE